METIDHEPHSWFLFQDGADLLLDCNCEGYACGYSVMIRLNPEEVAEYRTRGRTYVAWLAEQVQNTGRDGAYQKRDVRRAQRP